MNPQSAFRCAAIAVAVLGDGKAFLDASAQEPPSQTVVHEIRPCDRPCGMRAVVVGELGEDDGPGMIESEESAGFLDRSGRMYIGVYPDHVLMFDSDGTFLRRLGRQGDGPGEMRNIGSLAIADEDSVFWILDRGRAVIMKFDWNGELAGEVKTRGWVPSGVGTIHLDGALAVHEGKISTADGVGYPLHLVDLDSGKIKASFGSETGEYDPSRERRLSVAVARGPGTAIWMARRRAYWIELWEPENRLLLSMRRDLEWFPDALVDREHTVHGQAREPEPQLTYISAEDSLLWVMINRSDQGWADAGEFDEQGRYDTVIELIDWKRRQVVASQRFDESYYPWVAPGIVGQVVITREGNVRYRVSRIERVDSGAASNAGSGVRNRGGMS